MVNKFLLGYPETMGHRGESSKQALLDSSLSATFNLYYDAKVMLLSFKQVFLSEFLEAGKKEGQRFCLSLLFLKNNKLKIPQKVYFGVAKL